MRVDLEHLARVQEHSIDHLTKLNPSPQIRFSSWVVEDAPTVGSKPRELQSLFLFQDEATGNWVAFCGQFWRWGKAVSVPQPPYAGAFWKQYGFPLTNNKEE